MVMSASIKNQSSPSTANALDGDNANKLFLFLNDILKSVGCILLRNTIGFDNFYASGFPPLTASLEATNPPAFHGKILLHFAPIRLSSSLESCCEQQTRKHDE